MKNSSEASAAQSKSSARRNRSTKDNNQVYLITGASESVVADAQRKNRFYAVTIGVRIASLFVVLMTDGWVQIAVFVTGMVAPWIGVQIANNIRQVQERSIEVVPRQRAALAAAEQRSDDAEGETVIIGDVVDEQESPSSTPSAESTAEPTGFDENGEHHDDTRS